MISLYDYQTDSKSRLFEAWRKNRSLMLQMPTGTGKTHVLAAVVNEVCGGKSLRTEQANEGSEIVDRNVKEYSAIYIIAHRRELVAQIEEKIEKFGISKADGGRVKVMSIQWLIRHWGDVGEEPRLVIIDEAHHAVAETYREMWKRWPNAKFLGLTATPCRMNRRGFTDLFDTLITSWSITEFIEKGYLSTFDYVSIRPGSEEQRLIDSLEKRGADGDYQIKEMNSVLNRNTSIERLYNSMELFAGGKKGIVYAIGIDHARRIAEYYSLRGVKAVPIDSKTPMAERKRMVEEFRTGNIKVLVNVDIFSEGFDCPDVEFVQLARPTLSLAKYLQQVGRGLRKTKDKKTCLLIDNVGLYRVFGLPTADWDWEALFRGIIPGKGRPATGNTVRTRVQSEPLSEETVHDCDMEVIIAHEQLLSKTGLMKAAGPVQTNADELKAWQDEDSGLWGLTCGGRLVTEARFVTVFDINCGLAAVRFKNMQCGIINDVGEIVWRKDGCRSMRFLKNRLLQIISNNKKSYMDMDNLHIYERKPKVKRYGNVELLEMDGTYYSRTKRIYVNSQGIDGQLIQWRNFYLSIYDKNVPYSIYNKDNQALERHAGYACILDGDSDDYYWRYCRLADGSIIVVDNDGKFYSVAEGKAKKYIGCLGSAEEWERCKTAIERMVRQAKEKWNAAETEWIEKRRQQLVLSEEAVPFKSGVRWGLKVGNRITVPPIYRNIKLPVGKYCAVEKNYSQWGVVAIDGTVMVEPRYSDIEISMKGIVTGTKVTGSKEQMKLP